jgi:hypothetical protein
LRRRRRYGHRRGRPAGTCTDLYPGIDIDRGTIARDCERDHNGRTFWYGDGITRTDLGRLRCERHSIVRFDGDDPQYDDVIDAASRLDPTSERAASAT